MIYPPALPCWGSRSDAIPLSCMESAEDLLMGSWQETPTGGKAWSQVDTCMESRQGMQCGSASISTGFLWGTPLSPLDYIR